jgi:hypothetical protein
MPTITNAPTAMAMPTRGIDERKPDRTRVGVVLVGRTRSGRGAVDAR